MLAAVPTNLYETGLILQNQTLKKYEENIECLAKKFNLNVVSISSVTRGPVCTILEAKAHLPKSGSILFLDCDGLYGDGIIEKFLQKVLDGNCDAAVTTFKSSLNHFSYVAVDKNGFVSHIKEKERISNNAIAGAYYFKDAKEFMSVAENHRTEILESKSEYFLSDVVGNYVLLGSKVESFEISASEYASVGTPEQLEEYLARM